MATHELSRRKWLMQSGTLLAAMGLGQELLANGDPHFFRKTYNDSEKAWIEISQNENPYGPPPKAIEAMMRAMKKGNRYPDDLLPGFMQHVGAKYNLGAEHVLLGAGSSELLGLLALYCAEKGGNAVAAYPTFKMWFKAAEQYGLKMKEVPLRSNKVHNLPAMLEAMDAETRMVYVVNPHNPTGTVLPADELKSFIAEASKNAVVLLDEAYTEYSDEPTLAAMVANNPNLVIAKTFSKIYGMAGIRAGYILAHPSLIEKLRQYLAWPNGTLSNISLAAAQGALQDEEFVKLSRQKNDDVKRMVTAEMNKMGYRVIPSHTNFLYYDISPYKGNLETGLETAGIHSMRVYERNTNWRRTSLGTMDEMKQFLAVLRG